MSDAELLASITGWALGCENARDHAAAVLKLRSRHLIAARKHRAPIGTWFAYRLTPAGFAQLLRIGTPEQYQRAVRQRRFYGYEPRPHNPLYAPMPGSRPC